MLILPILDRRLLTFARPFTILFNMKNPIVLPFLFLLMQAVGVFAQDTIKFQDNQFLLVEIIEENEHRVLYKKFESKDTLTHSIQKRFDMETGYFNPADRAAKFKIDTIGQQVQLELWVTKMGEGEVMNGFLQEVNDSMMVLKKQSAFFIGNRKGVPEMVYILPYNQIKHIAARRQNRILQNAFIGAAIGFGVGTLSGMIAFKDTEPCDPVLADGCDDSLKSPRGVFEKSLLLGFGSAGAGALAGGLYGGVKVKIPIGGERYLFNAAVPRLLRMKRALRK